MVIPGSREFHCTFRFEPLSVVLKYLVKLADLTECLSWATCDISNSGCSQLNPYIRPMPIPPICASPNLERCQMELPHELQNNSTNHGFHEGTAGVPALERHYTVAELSKLWFFSENTIRRLFTKEPGVIKIARQETRIKRGYTSLRIPERIAQRVHRRMQGIA